MIKPSRIAIIYNGGVPFLAKSDSEAIIQQITDYLKLQFVADYHIQTISNPASADTTYEDALAAAKVVNDLYDKYDGFVILQGLDTAIYLANFFTFLFGALGKPVIFTGCALPDKNASTEIGNTNLQQQRLYREMGFRTNLVTAVQMGVLNCAGTFLAYSQQIVRAVRAVEVSTDPVHSFQSWRELEPAEVQFGVALLKTMPPRRRVNIDFVPTYGRVYVASAYPPMTLPPDLEKNYQGLVIVGYRDYPFPTSLSLPNSIPVVVYHPTPMAFYKQPANVVIASSITLPATIGKTMALLGRTSSLKEFIKEFQRDRQGELFETR